MTNEQRINFLKMISTLIFSSKEMNTEITQVSFTTTSGTWPGRWYVNNTLRGFDFELNLDNRTISLRCVEQNPNKTDNNGNLKKYAILAQQGHKIMWVIDNKNNRFLGRIHNDVWHASFVPATQPVVGTPNAYDSPEQEAREDAAYNQVNQEWHNTPSGGPATSLPSPMDINNLPEIPNGVDIPDYVFEQIAALDEPPEWDEI